MKNETCPPLVSVVLGRVSTEDGDRILETIAALQPDVTGALCEIVIADRINDAVSKRIARAYPGVLLIPCRADMSLPEMRTVAFEASVGDIVGVTEDHCVPCAGWVAMVSDAFANGSATLAAVGGSVVNGVTETGLDWATFLCEYSFFSPPVVEGPSDILPGMNVAYRRAFLEAVPRDRLIDGFWETTVHPLLAAAGGELRSLNGLAMYHKKRFSWRLFARQRFIYSRYYAGMRFRSGGLVKRTAAAAACLLLPPILLWRMSTAVRDKGLTSEFRSALPWLAMLVVIWAIGESIGALFGPGDALERIE